ncbi:4'-phosphopantetheinyl transferase superfamily protein [Christiangramia sediminis]|uniref:4'-phosphopantetheinyl transferase superfamily protein n=1 Tax=Christiangramia sediminis TaxID=2881336 RepID=A0A9X1LH41_9FLAO|nr:4'-phosphopantetheinyl transferase superfamily protein [Christiangramia sediminis]MCB7480177.1 4'-phosphopantetheinyl transferase superfamily protein [Christiangramia sediminis]
MIGNDIIDLKVSLANKRAENHRFLRKIFNQDEILTIWNSKNPELMLWQFWSMKEAAYKAHQRKFNLARKLNPISYNCSLHSGDISGTVEIERETYILKTVINPEYIHTWVDSGKNIQKVYDNKSYSRRDLIQDIILELGLNNSYTSISKDLNGIPSLFLENDNKSIPFSLSHHGNFTALSIPLIMC